MFGRHAFGLLLLIIPSALPGNAQQLTRSNSAFSIDGTVRDITDQRGLENIRVDLRESDGSPVDTAVTRTNGAFDFTGVANGDYILAINAQDYAPFRRSMEIMNSGRRGITLFLSRPVNMGVLNINNGTISAHQLSAPRKAQDEFDKGMNLLYGKADFHEAIRHFQRAIKDFPTYYEAYALEGTAYQSLGDAPAAEAALRKSVELSSGQYSEALFLLSALLSNGKRYQEAATLARKSVGVDTISWQGPFELARALFGLKQYDEAEKSALQARDRNPQNPGIYILLANIHIARHDFPSLTKDLDAYLRLAPGGPDAVWVHKTQELLQQTRKPGKEAAAREDAQGKSATDGQDPDGTIDPDGLEPDSSGLPPLPPPSAGNP
jgi:tetratricopeptide (TPR) repeat protein